MLFWVWLILLGLITYVVIRRSVAHLTRTPVWLLWLVMMIPALTWVGWALLNGQQQPIPTVFVITPLVVSPILYWVLVQQGRLTLPESTPKPEALTFPDAAADPPTEAATHPPPLRPLTKAEESQLHSCFPWSVYYLQDIEYRPQAVVCRGQLRIQPEVAYERVRTNIQQFFGDRFLVIFQNGNNGKPFFALVPNPQLGSRPTPDSLNCTWTALGLLLITLFTTTLAGVSLAGIETETAQRDPSLLRHGLPYAIALLAILGTHEMGHYLTARYYRLRATLPYFIPVLPFSFFPLGTFGAFIQIRSPMPNRKVLFDVGIMGPIAGWVVSMPFLVWGMAHSQVVPLSAELAKTGGFSFQELDPKVSLLLMLVTKGVLGSELGLNSAIALHPVAIAGCIGLVVTALNLMPVGQLDGGNIVHAMYGQRIGSAIGQIARLLILMLSLLQPYLLIWAIILFFMPTVDEPALNDVSELDNWRDCFGLLALGLLVLIVLPTPAIVSRWLLG
ncbi:site-2 protease family protein [Trichothermofontia sp.]